jgi:hypothetical protein
MWRESTLRFLESKLNDDCRAKRGLPPLSRLPQARSARTKASVQEDLASGRLKLASSVDDEDDDDSIVLEKRLLQVLAIFINASSFTFIRFRRSMGRKRKGSDYVRSAPTPAVARNQNRAPKGQLTILARTRMTECSTLTEVAKWSPSQGVHRSKPTRLTGKSPHSTGPLTTQTCCWAS